MPKVLKIILIVIAVLILLLLIGIGIYRLILHLTPKQKLRDNLDQKLISSQGEREAIVYIENAKGDKKHLISHGMNLKDKFYLASISKLYTHAVIFALVDEGLIDLSKSIADYLPASTYEGILMYKGIDHSSEILISDLINQTSGLADYEMDFKGDQSIVKRLMKEDFPITDAEAIQLTRKLEARHLPKDEKAHYSNLNAILLGLVAEEVTQEPLDVLYEFYIFDLLRLESTEVLSESSDVIHPYIGKDKADRSLYVSSAVACGGLISTAEELMIFLRAFYNGRLFSEEHIQNPVYRSIQFIPLQYGAGMMSVEMNALMSPLFPAPQILGHSGLSGSFAFYCPSKDLFIVGSVNTFEANVFQWVYQYIHAWDGE